ncbi:MAG: SRPBCC domain-containing protein, partial [Bacteroidota bacterium]|nr:SRPBCC domain-containing protein [Kiloniellaceae bacterium]
GGAAGFAKGSAKVRLEEDGGATVLHYEVKADVGGKLAQLGSRLIDGTARKLSGEFFTRFAAIVAGQDEGAAPPAPGAAAEAQTVAPPQAAPAAPASRPLVWIGALVVAAALLVGYILVAG